MGHYQETRQDLNMAGIHFEAYAPIPLAASGLAKTGPGVLGGILVGTSSSLTIKVWDALTATGTVILETTAALTAGQFLRIPAGFGVGCFVTIGGTGTVTVFVG